MTNLIIFRGYQSKDDNRWRLKGGGGKGGQGQSGSQTYPIIKSQSTVTVTGASKK